MHGLRSLTLPGQLFARDTHIMSVLKESLCALDDIRELRLLCASSVWFTADMVEILESIVRHRVDVRIVLDGKNVIGSDLDDLRHDRTECKAKGEPM